MALEEIIDDRHMDKLYAPRMEALFFPNEDGSPSLSGQLTFFTQKWHFRDGRRLAVSDGPVIRHQFDSLAGRQWSLPDGTQVNTIEAILLIEDIFTTLAREQLEPVNAIPDIIVSPDTDSLRAEDARDAGQLQPAAD